MKPLMGAVLLCLMPIITQAQDAKRLILSPKSNIDTSEIAEGFRKHCPNVMVTEDQTKADYILEAAEVTSFDKGDSTRSWHFTLLSKDGDVLFTTHPKITFAGRAHHFEETCKFLNGPKKKGRNQ